MSIINSIKTTAGKGMMKIAKVSPELALAGGVICGVGALVMGIMAHKKITEAIEETHKELDIIQQDAEDEDEPEEIAERKKMTWKAYNKLVWKIAKAIAPALGLEVASVALILLSHGILNKRYLGVSAAYEALDAAFKGYRMRVRNIIGTDAEKLVMAGSHIEKDISVQNDDGTVNELKDDCAIIDDHEQSPYEFNFNQYTSSMWSSNPDYSELSLRNVENWANDLLNARGHVFLNEVLDALGMKRTPAGAVCGWVKGAGDDYVDFGYLNSFTHDYSIDPNLCRKNIHLNFNCDGVIWNKI